MGVSCPITHRSNGRSLDVRRGPRAVPSVETVRIPQCGDVGPTFRSYARSYGGAPSLRPGAGTRRSRLVHERARAPRPRTRADCWTDRYLAVPGGTDELDDRRLQHRPVRAGARPG